MIGWVILLVVAARRSAATFFLCNAISGEDFPDVEAIDEYAAYAATARALAGLDGDRDEAVASLEGSMAHMDVLRQEAQAEQLDVEVRINDTRLLP